MKLQKFDKYTAKQIHELAQTILDQVTLDEELESKSALPEIKNRSASFFKAHEFKKTSDKEKKSVVAFGSCTARF